MTHLGGRRGRKGCGPTWTEPACTWGEETRGRREGPQVSVCSGSRTLEPSSPLGSLLLFPGPETLPKLQATAGPDKDAGQLEGQAKPPRAPSRLLQPPPT